MIFTSLPKCTILNVSSSQCIWAAPEPWCFPYSNNTLVSVDKFYNNKIWYPFTGCNKALLHLPVIFFSIWFCLGFSPYVLSFLFFVLLGVCFVFTQLIVFPVVKVVLFAMPPNTSYMSAIHNNFEVENYFLYKCAFFCIFQSLLLFFQFSSKLLFSLYYFTCCNCFVIYKIKVGLVYSFHHCQNLSERTAIPLITIALFCFVLMIIALVILL